MSSLAFAKPYGSVLDLRKDGTLSLADATRIDELEPEVRQAYNKYIESLINSNKLRGTALFLKVTCRNTILSQLLDHMCKLALLEDRLRNDVRYDAIVIDTPTLKKTIKQMLEKYNVSDVPIQCTARPYSFLKNATKNLVISVYGALSDLFWSRFYRTKKLPKEKVLLVDTFLFTYSFDSPGPFIDRFYLGHEEYLSDEQLNSRWFTATFIGVRKPADYKKVFQGVANSDANFLLQESWCSLLDYLIAFTQSFLLPFKIKTIPSVQGIEYSDLILQEAKSEVFAFSLIKTICKYRFIRQLAKAGVDIHSAIDWHENQVGDRAYNYGLKSFFSEVTVHGYQGYSVPAFYACTQPQKFERDLNTVPDIFHVINREQLRIRQDAYDGIIATLSPAFRFSYLYNIVRTPAEYTTVLVVLPIMVDESRKLVQATLDILDNIENDIEVIVKHHPSLTRSRFIELVPEALDGRLSITELSMPELLKRVTFLISSTSSACIEAVALGVPVAIMGNWSGVTLNPIPNIVSSDLWCVFYSSEQLSEFMTRILTQPAAAQMVDTLFERVDEQKTKALFQCPI